MKEGEFFAIRTSDLQLSMYATLPMIAKVKRFLEWLEEETDKPFPDWMWNAGKWEVT
jgi:hypothetical protein